MDSTLVDQCRKDHTESRRGHIDLQKSPSSSYRSDKVKQCIDNSRHLLRGPGGGTRRVPGPGGGASPETG